MPWRETWPMEERVRFIAELRRAESFAALCRQFGVSRKTGYKWLGRHEEEGHSGLEDRSRVSLRHPNATAPGSVQRILDLRAAHPGWGARKLHKWLTRWSAEQDWPTVSTIGDILRRHGLTRPLPRHHRAPRATEPLRHATKPNDVWSIDFKGWFRTGDGARCDPLTICDAFSRYSFAIKALKRTSGDCVRPVLERCFRENGLPLGLRSDNGPPFGSTGRAGLTQLSIWLVKLGVRPERIEPGHPEQNGRHERFHRTLNEETANPAAATVALQQRIFDRFRETYNRQRPHEALGMRTPEDVHVPSERRFPARTPEVGHAPGSELRRVRHNGEIKWAGELYYVTHALAGEDVALRLVDDRHLTVSFGPVELGLIDEWKRSWADQRPDAR